MAINKGIVGIGDAGGITRNATNPFGDSSELALYKFEDNANDAEGNYNGTASNVTYASGYIDKAAVFNGSSSKIDASGFNITGSRSVSFWVSTEENSTTTTGTVISTANDGEETNEGICIRHTTSGTFILSVTGANPLIGNTSSNWQHIVVTDDATNYKVYLNGSLVLTQSVQSGRENLSKIRLGNRFNFDQDFKGKIDQVRIFNRALDSGEVNALYNE
jgi:hypothetical protein